MARKTEFWNSKEADLSCLISLSVMIMHIQNSAAESRGMRGNSAPYFFIIDQKERHISVTSNKEMCIFHISEWECLEIIVTGHGQWDKSLPLMKSLGTIQTNRTLCKLNIGKDVQYVCLNPIHCGQFTCLPSVQSWKSGMDWSI